jgi:hypothetical protein
VVIFGGSEQPVLEAFEAGDFRWDSEKRYAIIMAADYRGDAKGRCHDRWYIGTEKYATPLTLLAGRKGHPVVTLEVGIIIRVGKLVLLLLNGGEGVVARIKHEGPGDAVDYRIALVAVVFCRSQCAKRMVMSDQWQQHLVANSL